MFLNKSFLIVIIHYNYVGNIPFFSVNPSTKPEIIGIKPNYGLGELVNVTCKSAPSRPQTCLKWFINGQEVR